MRRLLTACILVLTLLLSPALSARADLGVIEQPLNPAGRAFEIHADNQGSVWVSDLSSRELWRITTANNSVQVYSLGAGINPSDATPDAYGNVWWVSGSSLYRMNAGSGDYTYWEITTNRLWSVGVDYQGKVWVNDDLYGTLYSFDPNYYDQVCGYSLNTNNQGYLAVAGNQVWVGDIKESKIYRLDPAANRVYWWALPSSHNPYDLALSGSDVWYTNAVNITVNGFGGIGRLNPWNSQVLEYSLPYSYGYGTNMITTTRGKIWYTEQTQSTFGQLDPNQANGTRYEDVTHDFFDMTPSCTYPYPSGYGSANIQTSTTSWGNNSYPVLSSSDGWKIYKLPGGSNPNGIAMTSMGWVVDTDRKVLVYFDAGIPALGHLKTYIPSVMR